MSHEYGNLVFGLFPHAVAPMLKKGVSVVLCCHNSETVIGATIRSIRDVRVPPGFGCEVIVVDNNCTDRTTEIIRREMAGSPLDLVIMEEKKPGLVHARVTGITAAQYEYLVFSDDDNILAADYVEKVLEFFPSHPDAGAVGGHVSALLPDNAEPPWFRDLQPVYACGPQAGESMSVSDTRMTLFGAGLALRTDVLREMLSSFPPLYLTGRTGGVLMRGDDSELCLRTLLLGYDVYYDSSLTLQHVILPHRLTWSYVRQARQGGGMASIVLRVYRTLIKGRVPPTYRRLLSKALGEWLGFLTDPPRLWRALREGTRESSDLNFLIGVTKGLIHFSPRKFHAIRSSLTKWHHDRRARRQK